MSETIPDLTIDKSTWGDGPWQSEPDRVEFVHAGFACLLLRNPRIGQLCGYVGVPREHPAYGRDYNGVDVEVHGGLTYANKCQGYVCHVPADGMPEDVWWLGFDAGHAWDLTPGLNATLASIGCPRDHGGLLEETYRDLPYMRHEVESLAEQLAQMSI